MDERFAVIAFLLDIFEMFGGKEVGRDERLLVLGTAAGRQTLAPPAAVPVVPAVTAVPGLEDEDEDEDEDEKA